MTYKICRICLCTDIPLQELYGDLLCYFQGICDYTSGITKHLCCSLCKESLKNNLDFRNKCLNSNKILQNWKCDKIQNKPSINCLHEILINSLNDSKTAEKYNDSANSEKPYEKSYEIADLQSAINKENIGKYSKHNDNIDEDIKLESVKHEVNSNFEIINCGTDYGLNNHCEGSNETVNDEQGIQNRIHFEDNQLDENNKSDEDNKSDDDDKFLIDCVSKTENNNPNKTKKKKDKSRIKVKKQDKRVYPRKGLSEYSQYEVVFEIQLFKTDEDARRELMGRCVSEPYVSARYRCDICYTVYKCEKLLQFHLKWHDLSAEFECDICSMRFATHKALRCHKAKCHRGKFACKLCPLVTYYGSAMKAHFQKHQGKTFKCHCDRVFNHISSYLTHKRTVHSSVHVCVSCARTFVSELGLLNHRLRAHQSKSKVDNEATALCEPCGLKFTNQQVYNVHLLNTDVHRDAAKNIIACPYCGLSFEDSVQLKSHKRQYHPKKRDTNDTIKCKLCGAEGTGRTWRRRHYGAEHPQVPYLEEVSEAKIHMCDQCGKRFSNICSLKDHLNTHSGLKPYACARCGAAFSSGRARAVHAELHAPPRRQCARCPATFRSASNLAVHMRTHIGIRRHLCDICPKAFLHRAALREHVRGVHRRLRRARPSQRQPTQ